MKQNIKGKFLMAASHLIVASCIISQPLYAQEQNTADDRKKLEVDIITVTASKRGAQLLREVPTSIQALSETH